MFRAFTSHIFFNGKIQIFPRGLFKKKCKNTFWHTLKEKGIFLNMIRVYIIINLC